MNQDSLSLLACLWLHEPDDEAVARAERELGLPAADPADLATAYAELFVMNVFPYGTVFTDPSGELNGLAAQNLTALFATHGYRPLDLNAVGAADHLGLCLGFLAHLSERASNDEFDSFHADLLAWAPVCCLAVEREPAVHPLYRALAARTLEWLLTNSGWQMANRHGVQRHATRHQPSAIGDMLSTDDEIRLSHLVRFFLAPARCGMFLSRSRLGRVAAKLGVRLPFGTRFDVAKTLFMAAGDTQGIERLLAVLTDEVEAWAEAYRGWAGRYPAWQPIAEVWLERTAETGRRLIEMKEVVESGRIA